MKAFLYMLLTCLPFISPAQYALLDTTVLSDAEKITVTRLEAYRQRVLKGENMSLIATLYSEDKGSVKTGGVYSGIARGQFVPEFEKVAFSLKPGEISEIFSTGYGFHFLQVLAAHDDVVDLRHILLTTKSNTK